MRRGIDSPKNKKARINGLLKTSNANNQRNLDCGTVFNSVSNDPT
jgi:hypothetical protein